MSLRVYVDPVCPYAYAASELVEAAARALGTDVVWEPVLLGALLRAHGRPDVPMDAMPAAKRRQIEADVRRRAAFHGLPLVFPAGHPVRSVDALRCALAVREDQRGELLHALFRAAWQQGRSLADRAVLQELVAPYGLDVDTVCGDPALRDALRQRTDAALARGVFGVPSFALDGSDDLDWGVDRLEAFVTRHGGTWKAPAPTGTAAAEPVVEVFHDVASPFSYLGVMQVEAAAACHGAQVVFTPILLGGLFQAIGTPIVPIATFSARRQAWTVRDMHLAAERAGVPFRYPEAFPLRTVHAQRVLVQEPRATRALYDAAWGRGLDVGQPEVLAEALSDFDADALLAGCADPAVKAGLRAHTERAVALGVCGVPTFRVGERLFWGQDRLDQVDAVLAGWAPPC